MENPNEIGCCGSYFEGCCHDDNQAKEDSCGCDDKNCDCVEEKEESEKGGCGCGCDC